MQLLFLCTKFFKKKKKKGTQYKEEKNLSFNAAKSCVCKVYYYVVLLNKRLMGTNIIA